MQGGGGVDLLNLTFYKENYFSTATSSQKQKKKLTQHSPKNKQTKKQTNKNQNIFTQTYQRNNK